MPEYLKLGWSFDKISKDQKKRKLEIDYALNNNLRCPGSGCNHILFKELTKSNVCVVGGAGSTNG